MGWGVVRLHPSSYIGCRSSRRCFQCLFEVFTRRRGLASSWPAANRGARDQQPTVHAATPDARV